MFRILIGLMLAIAPLSAAGNDPLVKYFVAFLYKGPQFAASSADTPERKLNHEQHIAFIEKMTADRKLVTYGPILDGGDLRGMYVFKAASLEEAREWANQEPSVK